jgi:hypothetical protein
MLFIAWLPFTRKSKWPAPIARGVAVGIIKRLRLGGKKAFVTGGGRGIEYCLPFLD